MQAIQIADMGDKWYRLFPTGEMRVYDGSNPNGKAIASKSPVTEQQFEAMILRIVDEREKGERIVFYGIKQAVEEANEIVAQERDKELAALIREQAQEIAIADTVWTLMTDTGQPHPEYRVGRKRRFVGAMPDADDIETEAMWREKAYGFSVA